MDKITAKVYKDGALWGKGPQEIRIVERPIAGIYGKLKNGQIVTKMGSNWYL